MTQPYTLALTSCARHDLLERSIRSFFENCDDNPSAIVVVEDSDLPMPQFMNRWRHIPTTWLSNGERRGQVHSLGRMVAAIKTPWCFTTEDDFEFSNGGFLRKSFEILQQYPYISMVSLRGDWGHPLVSDPKFPFKIAEPYWHGSWGGWSWNPSARRTADLTKFGAVAKYGKQNGLGHEAAMSQEFLDAGYRIAALPNHCCHIGNGRSKAIEKIEVREPRTLVAVLACHKKSYGAWESEASEHYDQRKAYNGQPYGTDIHISGAPDPGIQAVRDTWANDVKAQPNMDLKFFYGEGGTRTPEADEVFLKCPDDYEHLPHKTIAAVKWALDNGYDYILKCDSDSYLWPDRLAQEIAEFTGDYGGYQHGSVCSGGCGYILSRRAMEAVQPQPFTWAEDVNTARCMQYANIESVMLPNHAPGFSNHWFDIDRVTPNLVCIHAVQPEKIRELWQREHQNR